jgi:YVTN family beta-propeller protein
MTGGLGDTGNDMIIYGGKMYIVVNNSGVVTVLNAAAAQFIAQVDFGNTAANRNPRFLLGTKGKVFVTAWDNKVSIIDTTSLTITGNIAVGPTPEGIATSGNYLYVANSGGSNYPDFDSTVSVIDLNTLTEIKKITVGINPQKLAVNSLGDVYVTGYGNFGSVPTFVSVIDGATNTYKTTLGTGYEFSHVRIFNDIAYLYNNYGGGTVKLYNTITNALVRNDFIADGTVIQTSYGVNFDEENGDVYIADAKDNVTAGSVTCFDKNGIKKFDFSVTPGISPNKILFLR